MCPDVLGRFVRSSPSQGDINFPLLNSLFDFTLVYRQSRLEGFRSDLVFRLGIGVAIAMIDENSIESAKEMSGNT